MKAVRPRSTIAATEADTRVSGCPQVRCTRICSSSFRSGIRHGRIRRSSSCRYSFRSRLRWFQSDVMCFLDWSLFSLCSVSALLWLQKVALSKGLTCGQAKPYSQTAVRGWHEPPDFWHWQSKHPCSAHVPHACSTLRRKAFRARWMRTAAFSAVIPDWFARSASGRSSRSTTRSASRYSGFRSASNSDTHSQISCRSAASGCWLPVNSLPQPSIARAEAER